MSRWLWSGVTLLALSLAVVAQSQEQAAPDTGLKVGDAVPAYNPVHVAGPDKGTNTCPV